jgi:hypothetical protein
MQDAGSRMQDRKAMPKLELPYITFLVSFIPGMTARAV